MKKALAITCALILVCAVVAMAGEALKRVEAKKVCMVNDALFMKDQIPVEVEGKTYYGCCDMCKKRLAEDAAIRTATDPVTGEEVDKATAVFGAMEDGTILYFASEENFEKYQQGEKKEG